MDRKKKPKDSQQPAARAGTSKDPSTTSDGAAASEPMSSPSVITDLTVSDYDFLEQVALMDSPGISGLQSLGLNVDEGLLAGLGSRNKYQVATPRIQVQMLPEPSGRRKNELAILTDQIDYIPSPRNSGGAGGAPEIWQGLNQVPSTVNVSCILNDQRPKAGGSGGAKVMGQQQNAGENVPAQVKEAIQHYRKEAMEKQSENQMLQEKLSQMEQKHGKKLLELTLHLQEKISKLEAYETVYAQLKGSATSENAFQSDILAKYGYSTEDSQRFKATLDQSLDLAGRLRSEREHLEKHRDMAELRYRELESKYNGLIVEMNQVKLDGKQALTDVKSSLHFKSFEAERMHLMLTEIEEKFKKSENENAGLKQKIEGMRGAMNDIQTELESNLTKLTVELKAKSSRLEMYERLEDSLDKLIISAAKAEETDLPSVIPDIHTIPTDMRRRIQQSVDVANRAFGLERAVSDQKQEILDLYDERQSLRCQIDTFKANMSRPVSNLIHAISDKNTEIDKLNKEIAILQKECLAMKSSKDTLQKSLDTTKEYQGHVLEMYKAASCVSSISTNTIPEKSTFVEESPDSSAPASILRRVHKQTRFADEEVHAKEEGLPPGSYFSLQKNVSSAAPSSVTITEDASRPRPVALLRTKVKPNKSAQF